MLNVIMLNVIMLNVIMLNVIMLNVIMINIILLNNIMLNIILLNGTMLNVIMLSVIMPSAMTPLLGFAISIEILLLFSNGLCDNPLTILFSEENYFIFRGKWFNFRYRAFRDDTGQFSPIHWKILALKFSFVIIFEVRAFSIRGPVS